MKGLLVHVLKSTLGDCTAGGLSSRYNSFVLVGRGVPEVFDVNELHPALILKENTRGWRAVPEAEPKDMCGPMFGGNYVVSSDSRFTEICGGPVPVHDRFESWTY